MSNPREFADRAVSWVRESAIEWYRERELVWLLVAGIVTHALLWICYFSWYSYNPLYGYFGLGILLINTVLGFVFARKERIVAQALEVTSITVQLLILVLIIRIGALAL